MGSIWGDLKLSQKSFNQVLPCRVQRVMHVLKLKTQLYVVVFKIIPHILAFSQSCTGFRCKGYL